MFRNRVLKVCAILALVALAIISYKRINEPKITKEPDTEESIRPEYWTEYYYGKVSYYDESYCEKYNPSCLTASGEVFNENALTAACSYDYPLQTLFRFHHEGRSVVVRCNDRGDFEKYGRVADLSKEAFESLGSPKSKDMVKFEVVMPEKEK